MAPYPIPKTCLNPTHSLRFNARTACAACRARESARCRPIHALLAPTRSHQSPCYQTHALGVHLYELTLPAYSRLARQVDHRRWLLQFRNKVRIGELEKGPLLGSGTSGRVYFAIDKRYGKAYAVKKVPQPSDDSEWARRKIMTEHAVLSVVNHPFIIKLVAGYEDPTHLNVVLEFVPGGELRGIMNAVGKLPLETARFYVANVTMALGHMHSLQIAYRDLKPENLLWHSSG